MRVVQDRRPMLHCTYAEFDEMHYNHTIFCTDCGHVSRNTTFYEEISMAENADEEAPCAAECPSCGCVTACTLEAASDEGLVIISE